MRRLIPGAGGLSLGFEQAGFHTIAAVERDPIHADTYSSNFPHTKTITADVQTLDATDFLCAARPSKTKPLVVIAGPPCQGFSLIGKRRRDDPRNELIFAFWQAVRTLEPDYFVMENVPGLLAASTREAYDAWANQVLAGGYELADPPWILNAQDYGVPQRRARLFAIGWRRGLLEPKPPLPQIGSTGQVTQLGLRPSVWDAIGDLPDPRKFRSLSSGDSVRAPLGEPSTYVAFLRGQITDPQDKSLPREHDMGLLTASRRTTHLARSRRRFGRTSPGEYEPVSRFYRLAKDQISPTLRAGTGPELGSFTAPRPIHPVQCRCITVREAARIHSFPDWFTFNKTVWHGFRQVGNSVPPLLARAVATAILRADTFAQDIV